MFVVAYDGNQPVFMQGGIAASFVRIDGTVCRILPGA